MTTTPQAALLREAAQNALITLDGIANANPRDKADFETPAEWIAWAKSRARWAADALRKPVAQEVYAERILKQMLHEASQSAQEPAASRIPSAKRKAIHEAWLRSSSRDFNSLVDAIEAEVLGRAPVQAGELPDEREAFEREMGDIFISDVDANALARFDPPNDAYVFYETQRAWQAWQARAALSDTHQQRQDGGEGK